MGASVQLLDDRLVDQIAAGEVIERPANLVKELLENAVDAAATSISVAVEDGGRACVRVSDDGVGMSPRDAELAIERHATSKIATFEDLLRVGTLGFRGEALPSIGSVAKMTITTREKDSLAGTRVVVEGGALREVGPVGCPPGTSVEVTDLFYNVPARRKFLRARQTEASRVFEACQGIALSDPTLRLVVTSDGRTVRQYHPTSDLLERASQVFRDVPLRAVEAARDGLRLDAALSAASDARSGARQLYLLVNGRSVSDRSLARAIAFAYGDALAPGQYPKGVVSIELPREDVDVNAHPQKTEVRFRHPSQLLDRITRMLASHLPSRVSSPAEGHWEARLGRRTLEPKRSSSSLPRLEERRAPFPALDRSFLRLVATVRESLLVCESRDELLVVDRSCADAVRRGQLLREALETGRAASHSLLFPDRVTVDDSMRSGMQSHSALLRSLGFDWSELADDVVVVRAVPGPVGDAPGDVTFEAALRSLSSDPDDSADRVVQALADVSAVPPGESIDETTTSLIVASIRPGTPAHAHCVVARVPLPRPGDSHA